MTLSCLCRTSQPQELDEQHKRKRMVAMDRVLIVMEGTVTKRDGVGGVEFTQNECANIIEHGLTAGVASMKTLGSQVENAFRQRALEVFSTTKTFIITINK